MAESDRAPFEPIPFPPAARREVAVAPLPAEVSSLVGRGPQIAALTAVFRQPEIRLVTLVGPGGVGKTRLALAGAAEIAREHVESAVLVPLAAVHEPGLVGAAIARVLGVRASSTQPLPDALANALCRKRVLLVLDNLEHLLDAAPFVGDLLAMCPKLSVLATSRTRLQIVGEHVFPVLPLDLPTADAREVEIVAAAPAVRLFVSRAQAAHPEFALTAQNAPAVAAVCRQLEGLPLAIELAAARTPVLSPPALLARLERRLPLLTGGPRNAPDRLRTMRGAIAWSYDLLSPADQTLFRRLTVFAGGCTLAAAEEVGQYAGDVLDGIASLVASSLLRQDESAGDEPRYVMLETVREFGWERLEGHGETPALQERHAAYFLALAQQAAPQLFGVEGRSWLAMLEREHDNIRAALAWAAMSAPEAWLLQFGGALWPFWYARGYHSEGRRWLRAALAAAAGSPLRAAAAAGAALLEHCGGDNATALAWGEEALALARARQDERGIAAALYVLGKIAEATGEYERAQTHFAEALAIAQAHNDPTWAGLILDHLGSIAFGRGELDQAETSLLEALAIQRTTGHGYGEAVSLLYLGHLAQARGDAVSAAQWYGESLTLWREEDFRPGIPEVLSGLASVAAIHGQPEQASRLFGAAETVRQVLGLPAGFPERPLYERSQTAAERELGATAFAAAFAAGRALPRDDALDEAAAFAAAVAAGAPLRPSGHDEVDAGALLTARERDVLRLVARGQTDREIADALFLSPRTVNTHVGRILAKLDAGNRREAVARGRALGLLPDRDEFAR
jgi:non-specific serine/threonine protein kinase